MKKKTTRQPLTDEPFNVRQWKVSEAIRLRTEAEKTIADAMSKSRSVEGAVNDPRVQSAVTQISVLNQIIPYIKK
jgi:hypothetical protein